MHPEEGPVAHAAERLARTFGEAPPTAIVLGSGLGALVSRLEGAQEAAFADLGLPVSSVHGHKGAIIRGALGPSQVALISGRVHLYEGWSANEVVRYVRALHAWGVKRLVLTCSAGAITYGIEPGALVAISDHVNYQRDNPLIGPSWPGGTRFPDLSNAYSPRIRTILRDTAAAQGLLWREGVYGAMTGPSYETPAEIRALRSVGCDLVGMSTVAEAIAAAHIGFEAAAIAVVSNRAAGLASEPLTHDEVMDIAGRAAKQLGDLFEVALARF